MENGRISQLNHSHRLIDMPRSHNHEKIENKSWNTRPTEQNVFSVFSLSVAKLRDWNVKGTKSSAFLRRKSKQNISTLVLGS